MEDCASSTLLFVLFVGIGGLLGDKFHGRKNAGLLLGLVGPIGWALVLLCEDQRPKCPGCRPPLNPGARRCARCGGEVRAAIAGGGAR